MNDYIYKHFNDFFLNKKGNKNCLKCGKPLKYFRFHLCLSCQRHVLRGFKVPKNQECHLLYKINKLCSRCKTPLLDDYKFLECPDCLKKRRQKDRIKAKTRFENHLCRSCGTPLPSDNVSRVCSKCQEREQQYSKERHKKNTEYVANGFCYKCHKPVNKYKYFCDDCENEKRKNYHFCINNKICPICHKEVLTNHKICSECAEKRSKQKKTYKVHLLTNKHTACNLPTVNTKHAVSYKKFASTDETSRCYNCNKVFSNIVKYNTSIEESRVLSHKEIHRKSKQKELKIHYKGDSDLPVCYSIRKSNKLKAEKIKKVSKEEFLSMVAHTRCYWCGLYLLVEAIYGKDSQDFDKKLITAFICKTTKRLPKGMSLDHLLIDFFKNKYNLKEALRLVNN